MSAPPSGMTPGGVRPGNRFVHPHCAAFLDRLPLPTSKGLSPQRLRRVRDYVEAHRDEDLSLTMLADIASLSPYHFSRSFKGAAGTGPQRYVIQCRVERAKPCCGGPPALA